MDFTKAVKSSVWIGKGRFNTVRQGNEVAVIPVVHVASTSFCLQGEFYELLIDRIRGLILLEQASLASSLFCGLLTQ